MKLNWLRKWLCSKGKHSTHIVEIKTGCWAVVDRELQCKHCDYWKSLPPKINYD